MTRLSSLRNDAAPPPSPEDHAERRHRIAEIIEALRPMLQADGGDMELVAVEGDIVRVGLRGACVGCGLAAQTLGTVRRALVEALGVPLRVLPAALS